MITALQAVKYRRDPVAFVREILGAHPTWQQEEILKALPASHAVAGRSGHGVGKSAVEAWSVLWFVSLHPHCRVPCTAPTQHQLDDILWPEINYWMTGTSLEHLLTWSKTRLAMKGFEETWFAVPRSCTKPENLQGFHGRHVLFVIDEASGVPQNIMEVVEGALTNNGARLLMMGNPTQISGTFYDAFHKDRRLYKTFGFNSEESPLVSPSYCQRMANKYGKDSDVYRVRVKGLFPKGSPDTLIRLDVVEEAIRREVRAAGRVFIGVDPARFGDDESVVCWRIGYKVFPLLSFQGIDTSRLTGEVARLIKVIRARGYNRLIEVRVDDTGIGGGVTDQLNQQKEELNITTIPLNFGGRGNDDYYDSGSLMWGGIKELLPFLALPDDDDLTAQLTTRKYTIKPDGRVKLEEKKEMKRRGLVSPDKGDALALCLVDTGAGTLGSQKSRKKPITGGIRKRKF